MLVLGNDLSAIAAQTTLVRKVVIKSWTTFGYVTPVYDYASQSSRFDDGNNDILCDISAARLRTIGSLSFKHCFLSYH